MPKKRARMNSVQRRVGVRSWPSASVVVRPRSFLVVVRKRVRVMSRERLI